MNNDYKKILNEIKGERALEDLLPQILKVFCIQKNYSILELFELTDEQIQRFNGFGEEKETHLKLFKNKINDNKDLFENYHNFFIVKHTIGVRTDLKLTNIELILSSISELCKFLISKLNFGIKNNIYSEKNREKTNIEKLVEYSSKYFGILESRIYSMEEMQTEFGTTRQSIVNILYDNPKQAFLKLFFEGVTIFNAQINKDTTSYIKNNLTENVYSTKFDQNFFYPEERNSETEEFTKKFVTILGYNITEFGNRFVLTETGKTGLYTKIITNLAKELRKGNELSKNEIIVKLKLTDKDEINILNKTLESNEKIEIVENYEGKILYRYEWQFLSGQNEKFERILCEAGQPLNINALKEEYNSREVDLGLEITETVNPVKETPKMYSVGNGYWIYGKKTIKIDSLLQKIKKDIETKFDGKISFTKFLSEVNKSEDYRFYKDNSIRTNILLCCRPTKENPDIFILNEFIERYSSEFTFNKNRNKFFGNSIIKTAIEIIREKKSGIGKNLLIDEIIDTLEKSGYVINHKGNVSQYLSKFINLGILTLSDNKITIDEEQIKTLDLDELGKKEPPEYKKIIKSKVVNYLKSRIKFEASLKEITDKFLVDLPENISVTNFYKIFLDEKIFKKQEKNGIAFVSLNTNFLPKPQSRQEESFEIVEEAKISELFKYPQERIKFNLKELKQAITEELLYDFRYYGLTIDNINQGFDFFVEKLVSKEHPKAWGNILVQVVFEFFCLKTDFYDRQICHNQLVTSFESYLKIICGNLRRYSGIMELISHEPFLTSLYNYKRNYTNKAEDPFMYNYSFIINQIKYLSDLYRHNRDDESLNIGNKAITRSIVDFTALYIYSVLKINSTNSSYSI